MDAKATLISLLGIEPESTDEAIANAAASFQTDMVAYKNTLDVEAEKLRNAAATATEENKSLKADKETLTNRVAELNEELVNHDLEKFADRITDADAVKEQLLANRAATLAVLNSTAAVEDKSREPMHKMTNGAHPKPVNGTSHPITEHQAKFISNRARELQKTLNVSHQEAFVMAKAEALKDE